jgi:endonuclease YncB( thermonuclease family)
MYEYKAMVLEVHDGDTVLLDIDLGFNVHTVQWCRLRGINAPELSQQPRGSNATRYLMTLLGISEYHQPASRTRRGNYVLDQPIGVLLRTILEPSSKSTKETEKYGRVLGTLYVGKNNINALMVAGGHAVEYKGD